jgi:hypothetical protein
MSHYKNYLPGTGAIVVILSALLMHCHSKKEDADRFNENVPSTSQVSTFDSLKFIIVDNKKLLEATAKAAKLNDWQRLSVTNTISQVTTKDFASITGGLTNDGINDYLHGLDAMIETLTAPYTLRGFDLKDSTRRDRITSFLQLKIELDSLSAPVPKQEDLVTNIGKTTALLHKMDSLFKADTVLLDIFGH